MNRTEYTEAVGKYLSALPSMNKSDKTEIAYRQTLTKFENFLRDEEITPLTVVNFRAFLAESGCANNTVNIHLVRLHAFFAWCIEMQIVQENPVAKSQIPDLQPITYSMLTLEQIEKIENYRPNKNAKTACRSHAIVLLLVQSGLRNAELRALTVADLDFENGTVLVRHGKGDKERIAPFPARSREVIREYLNSGIRPGDLPDDAPLFGSSSDETGAHGRGEWHEISGQALNMIVKRTVKKIVGAEVHTHTLRHCATSKWAEMDVPMRTVQLALGHSRLATTEQTYTHVLRKDRAAVGINEAYARAEQNR